METEKKYILDEATAAVKLERMAYEIAEELGGINERIILAGVRDNGVVMAHILARLIKEIAGLDSEIIELTLDKRNPGPVVLNHEPDFNNRIVILVDDVVNSGKTSLYALKPFLNSHPRQIQLLTLIERTHKVFPVKADYVGISLATTLQEHIYVEVSGDRVTGAYMI